jgi:hypothetical protein
MKPDPRRICPRCERYLPIGTAFCLSCREDAARERVRREREETRLRVGHRARHFAYWACVSALENLSFAAHDADDAERAPLARAYTSVSRALRDLAPRHAVVNPLAGNIPAAITPSTSGENGCPTRQLTP